MSLHIISAKIFPRPASDERGAFLTTADGAVVDARGLSSTGCGINYG